MCFFSLFILNYRRRYNSISGLFVDGNWVEDPVVVKEEVRAFFAAKFSAISVNRPLLDGVGFSQISEDDNLMLCAKFELEELKEAVWQCEGDKSPGPDGINFKFIKNLWHILSKDVLSVAEDFFENGVWPRGSNASFIALVPKVSSTQGLNDFRPISLVGCMYKIIAKVLAGRLKNVMGKLISGEQSA